MGLKQKEQEQETEGTAAGTQVPVVFTDMSTSPEPAKKMKPGTDFGAGLSRRCCRNRRGVQPTPLRKYNTERFGTTR